MLCPGPVRVGGRSVTKMEGQNVNYWCVFHELLTEIFFSSNRVNASRKKNKHSKRLEVLLTFYVLEEVRVKEHHFTVYFKD